jgi:hypothetical protein
LQHLPPLSGLAAEAEAENLTSGIEANG